MSMNQGSSQEKNHGTTGNAKGSISHGPMLITVLLLFLGATYVAFTQSPRLNLLQPPTLSERLLYPWETNALERLPIVIGNVNALFVLPDSQLVWAVGDGGMILHSVDGGITWVQQDYPDGAAAKNAAAIPLSSVDSPALFSKAVAADDPSDYPNRVEDNNQTQMQKGIESSSASETQNYQQTSPPDKSIQSPPAEPAPIIPDDRPADLNLVYFEDAKTGIILSNNGINLGTADGGATWRLGAGDARLELQARNLVARSGQLLASMGGNRWQDVRVKFPHLSQLDDRAFIVAVGLKGVTFKVNKNGEWLEQKKFTDSNLNAIETIGSKGWLVVGDDGLIAQSTDDGETWHPLSRGRFTWLGVAADKLSTEDNESDAASYGRFPAPWYWLVCCFVIAYGISFFSRKRLDSAPQEKSITDLLAPDRPLRPGDPDPLGFNSIACGLSRFMRNPSTEPPLTLAITGAWGSGKSSLMNLLYYDLKKFGFTPVWFNAWHHQKGEQLLASLYANIRNQAIPGLFSFSQLFPVGLVFRINLLFRRGVKHWLMTVTLIGVFAASATYLLTHSDSSSVSVNKITEALATPGFSWETLLIALFGNVAPLMALLQTLRAFGLNPLSLMTAQGDRQAQGRVDPSARQQFAREFNEVAKSLSLGRMVIFIDDLDRCSKENVVDILEAINFLSVSGDCYIVLGMDETWVKICINEHFKEMSIRNPDFADQYLEKMINIKVPVPQLSETDSSNLLALELPGTDENETVMVQMWRIVKIGLFPYRYFLLMICVVILGVCFGFFLDSMIRSESKPASTQHTIAIWNNIDINEIAMVGGNPNLSLRVQDNAASMPSPGDSSSWQLSLNATEDDLKKGIVIGKLGDAKASASLLLKAKIPAQATTDTSGENAQITEEISSRSGAAKFVVGQQDSSINDYWLPLLVGALLVLGVIAYIRKMPVRRPEDSADFKKALEIWKPWILLNRQTPRAIKRYLNRVRYMAMRYRAEPEPQSTGVREALSRLFHKRDVDGQITQQSDSHFEAHLVALSAIQAADIPWAASVFDVRSVRTQDLQELVKIKFGEQAANSEAAMMLIQRLQAAIDSHRKRFGDSIVVDDGEQEKVAKILGDMQVK
jgi:hypothetical protein